MSVNRSYKFHWTSWVFCLSDNLRWLAVWGWRMLAHKRQISPIYIGRIIRVIQKTTRQPHGYQMAPLTQYVELPSDPKATRPASWIPDTSLIWDLFLVVAQAQAGCNRGNSFEQRRQGLSQCVSGGLSATPEATSSHNQSWCTKMTNTRLP